MVRTFGCGVIGRGADATEERGVDEIEEGGDATAGRGVDEIEEGGDGGSIEASDFGRRDKDSLRGANVGEKSPPNLFVFLTPRCPSPDLPPGPGVGGTSN